MRNVEISATANLHSRQERCWH